MTFNKRNGQIKFRGVLNSKKYLGICWDDLNGKHDGTFEGKKYFETRTKTSGSFVRYFGIHESYALNYTNQTEITLSNCLFIKEDVQLVKLMSHVVQIDLTHSFLQDWEEINKLCDLLTSLEVLVFNQTKFTGTPNLKVRVLSLNQTNMSSIHLDQVEELHLAGNMIHHLSLKCPKLKILDLHDNNVDLTLLPRVETLILSKNNIKTVPKLETKNLILNDNLISDFSFESLPLNSLKILRNPIYKSREEVIARMPHLHSLNGTIITPDERKNVLYRRDEKINNLCTIKLGSKSFKVPKQTSVKMFKMIAKKHNIQLDWDDLKQVSFYSE